ncbi:hypothetical protein [Lebetimonas sp. JH292]|uniref:hypothetical protein n=1 Tax=Lebetimonas sp. JH292 TaxID=990068 RepID=UPI00046624F3|nr:hypothetical protein [Lebetimonas sp. JH292]
MNIFEISKSFKKIIENYNKHHLDKYIFIDSEKGGILVYPDSKLLGNDIYIIKNQIESFYLNEFLFHC